MKPDGGEAGRTSGLLGQMHHLNEVFVVQGIAPSLQENPAGKMEILADFLEGLQRHILKNPLLREDGPRTHLAFHG